MQDYIKLLKFLKGYEKLFAVAVLAMLASSVLAGLELGLMVPMFDRIFSDKSIVVANKLPDVLQGFIDHLNQMDRIDLFESMPAILIIYMVVKSIAIYIHSFLMNKIGQAVMRDVRFRLYESIQNLSLDYFSKQRTGELISRITHDVNLIENAVSYGLTDLFKQSFMIIVCITVSFAIYPLGAFIIFCVFPFIGIPLSIIGKRLKKISKGTQEKMADINAHLIETISGVMLVKAFCNEAKEVADYMGKNVDYYKLRMKSIKRMLYISPITEIFGGLCGVGMYYWMGRKVMMEELSAGVFILFFGSIMRIISPIKKLGNVNGLVQQAIAANDRIYDVLDKKPTVEEKENASELAELKEQILIKDVSFHYYEETGDVLKNINLEINKGELVAVVGPTGTGKTTLINLIPRFYDPTDGVVSFDGVNLKDVTFKSLRKQIGIVSQDTVLFNDTVRNNIAYGNEDATQEEIESAAHKAFAHHFVDEMSEKYETFVGDRGFRLSGGEKQRLSIARAILKNPPILILDEATSALDSESEKFVQEALDKLMQGRTVIAIAHRLSTVKKADKIVCMDNGQIVGLGKHEQLLETCPLYKKLHSMQFQA